MLLFYKVFWKKFLMNTKAAFIWSKKKKAILLIVKYYYTFLFLKNNLFLLSGKSEYSVITSMSNDPSEMYEKQVQKKIVYLKQKIVCDCVKAFTVTFE